MSTDGEGLIRKAGEVGPDNLLFTEEALRAQDGAKVPLRLEINGPVIGEATMHYDAEEQALKAIFRVDDPEVADALLRNRPRYF